MDKALYIVIFFYAAGIMMVGIEYTAGQIVHVEMISPLTGEPVNTAIVGYLQLGDFDVRTENIVTGNYTANSTFFDKIETFTTGAAFVAWELIGLMTGTFIFHIMLLFGVPVWMVTMFILLYVLLLARAIIGYVQRV